MDTRYLRELKALAIALVLFLSSTRTMRIASASAAPQETSIGIEFVRIQPGEFIMGCSEGDNQCFDEETAHRVRITKGVEIGKYEVTQAQWQAVMGNNPSTFKGANLPVETVSWNDVQQFLDRMNARNDGYHYRLPTEAEWEYAARAGSTGAYSGSLGQIAWYGNNSGLSVLDTDAIWANDKSNRKSNYVKRIDDNANQSHPVGQKQPNAWGLYDMHGNVAEWVQDWYDANYYNRLQSDPAGPSSGHSRVWRGGYWGGRSQILRVSFRGRSAPTDRDLSLANIRFWSTQNSNK
jgi:formylglycine-generating enzyme required for sulfatase activity